MRSIHFIGIGGVGMNGLAQLAAQFGYTVSGSDRAYHPTGRPFDVLEKLGIRITPQDGTGISEQTAKVVYSTAIESDNPDLTVAKERGIPLLHRSEFLKELIGSDDLIAVAAGTYAENVFISKPVRLWGKCPSEVVINGPAAQPAAVFIQDTSDVEVHDIALTGEGVGIAVLDSASVTIDRVWIHDTASMGMNVATDSTPASATLERSLVEKATLFGLYGIGATTVVNASELRGTVVGSNGAYGRGITVLDTPSGSHRATLTVTGSYVHHNVDFGIRAAGADVILRDTLVADTAAPSAGSDASGNGVQLRATQATGQRSTGLLERLVIQDSNECGICVYNSDAEIVNTTVVRVTRVTDTNAETATQGVFARGSGEVPDSRPDLRLRSSMVKDVQGYGVRTWNAEGTLEGVVVRHTEGSESNDGSGLYVHPHWDTGEPSNVLVAGSRIESVVNDGILVQASDATIVGTLVADVARRADGAFGRGISIERTGDLPDGPTADISCSCVERVHEAGIAGIGARLTIESTLIRDVLPSANTISSHNMCAGVLAQRGFEPEDFTSLSIVSSEIHNVETIGIAVVGTTATLSRIWVHDITANEEDKFGDGIGALPWPLPPEPLPAKLTVDQTLIEGSVRAGIASFGGAIAMGDSLLRCNTMQMVADPAADLQASITDLGGVRCGCGQNAEVCKVLSNSLEAPSPLLE
jgi:hypothetical protein